VIKDFGPVGGLVFLAYEAHRFAKHALSLADEAKLVAQRTGEAITEIRIATEKLTVVVDSLAARVERLEDTENRVYYVTEEN
jgi:hypothetical protein